MHRCLTETVEGQAYPASRSSKTAASKASLRRLDIKPSTFSAM